MADLFDLAVIGGGIAGLVAAREAVVAGVRVAHILGADVMGGLVANVGALDDFTGGPVAGIDLAATLMSEAADHGVLPVMEDARSLANHGDHYRITAGGETINARAVILATGARLRSLDVPRAAKFAGRGVSQCGWCDGPLYRAKSVVVVGGGDAAAHEALHLTEHAAKVTLLVRDSALKARQDYRLQLAANPRIEVRTGTTVAAIEGGDTVTGLRVLSGASESLLPADAVFVFIGLAPATAWLPAGLARDAIGALITDAQLMTSWPRVAAVGACRSGYSGALDDAIDEGRRAVLLLRDPH